MPATKRDYYEILSVQKTASEDEIKAIAASAQVPRLFLLENEYAVAIAAAEAAWLITLLDELIGGTHPDLGSWRAWHATGEMPEGLAALAERGATTD